MKSNKLLPTQLNDIYAQDKLVQSIFDTHEKENCTRGQALISCVQLLSALRETK